jgi:xylulokinase
MLATGTAWVITGVADRPDVAALPPQMDLNAHVVPGRWTISTYMGGFGAMVEWWLNTTAPQKSDKYAALQHALGTTRPGGTGLLFAPESQARAGSRFVGLKLSHTWDDMTRAIVEGVAFEVRHRVGALREADLPVHALVMLGGAARSAQWPRVLADATGIPIRACDDSFLGARGAAILAGVGAGLFDSAADAWPRFAPRSRLTLPDADTQAIYDAHYAEYRQL